MTRMFNVQHRCKTGYGAADDLITGLDCANHPFVLTLTMFLWARLLKMGKHPIELSETRSAILHP